MSEEWKVGDKIALCDRHIMTPRGPFEIVKVGKRKITLNGNGGEWTNARWPSRWGSSRERSYCDSSFERWSEKHDEQIAEARRKNAAWAVLKTVQKAAGDLTWDQINAIRAALDIKDEQE